MHILEDEYLHIIWCWELNEIFLETLKILLPSDLAKDNIGCSELSDFFIDISKGYRVEEFTSCNCDDPVWDKACNPTVPST